MLADPEIEAPLNKFERLARELLVCENMDAGFEQLLAGGYFADWLAEPANDAVTGEDESLVDGLMDARGAALDLTCQGFLRGGIQRLGGFARRLRIKAEAESGQMSGMLTLDDHIAATGDFHFQHRVLS